jgi:hypothetical protein
MYAPDYLAQQTKRTGIASPTNQQNRKSTEGKQHGKSGQYYCPVIRRKIMATKCRQNAK